MSDALISPAVGGAMWAASAGLVAYSAHRLRREAAEERAPLMGVLGAFVFAAQMITFAIPLTGSSGHLGGGLLLAILLGPHAGFLTMFSILAVQALFFADGGLLALGCNAFNLGFWPCFVAHPLVRGWLHGGERARRWVILGAGMAALQLGAFGVVLQTSASGISELPFAPFALFMQPIHLAIGLVEGAVTAALVAFVLRARPELIAPAAADPAARSASVRSVLVAFAVGALIVAGGLSWLASAHPDGLEWAMAKVHGGEPAAPAGGVHGRLAAVQECTAVMPDYSAGRAGPPVAGLLGGAIVLALAGLIGFGFRLRRRAERV